MRKLLVLGIAFIISTTSCYAWGWFGKKDTSASPQQVDNKGYVGTLPDVSKGFKSTEPKNASPVIDSTKQFNSSEEIKPVPRDNPAFVNIILKEDKTSPYLNDINNDILPQLENLLTCIDEHDSVQIFNAKAFFFNKTAEYLRNKYAGKPESSYVSFKKLMQLSTQAQAVANLRAEAEKYRPYLAYSGAGYLYNDNVIQQQLEYLKTEIEDTITVLKDAR